jgi:hypothetical protein
MRNAMRSASVALLEGYAASVNVAMQVYPARPRSIYPPTGFVDAINEPTITYTGLRQRHPQAELVIVHDIFDSKEAAQQADDFVDGFIDWVTDNASAAGAATLIEVRATEDDPEFVPEWMPPEQQKQYYATRITLEGLSLDAN